jgi:3-deoxy-D-manno-octulosonic acid (KDO) 8-phosphate synthase
MVSCQPFKLIADPCMIENPELQFSIAVQMQDITDGLGITCVF